MESVLLATSTSRLSQSTKIPRNIRARLLLVLLDEIIYHPVVEVFSSETSIIGSS